VCPASNVDLDSRFRGNDSLPVGLRRARPEPVEGLSPTYPVLVLVGQQNENSLVPRSLEWDTVSLVDEEVVLH